MAGISFRDYVLKEAPKLFGTTSVDLAVPARIDSEVASNFMMLVNKFGEEAKKAIIQLKKKDRELTSQEEEILRHLPELKRKAAEALSEIQQSKASMALADCLKRFDALGITTEDPYFNIRFTFEHNLDICREYLPKVYDGELDVNAAITDPNYLDQLIISNPDAVYLRGFIYLVAEGAYEQHTQSDDVFKLIANNPHLTQDQVKYLLVHQQDVDNNTYVQERMEFYVWAINKLRENKLFVDERSNGHHMNYFMLPNLNLNAKVVREFGVDKHGKFYTEEEKRAFLKSMDSRPMLEHDFGYKQLIRLTDNFIRYQKESGMFMTTKTHFRCHDIVEEYEDLTAPSM